MNTFADPKMQIYHCKSQILFKEKVLEQTKSYQKDQNSYK